MALAELGLNGFFIISGFFIYRSFQRSPDVWVFLKKRVLRIFPGLLMVLVLSFLLVPFVYEGSSPLTHVTEWYTYIPYNFSLYGFQGVVPGVFDNNYYHAINGSLWTIRYEFTLYLAVALLFVVKFRHQLVRAVIGISLLLMLVSYFLFLEQLGGISIIGLTGTNMLNLGTFFVMGSLLATFKFEEHPYKYWWLFALGIVFIACIYFNCYSEVKHLLYSPIVLLLGFTVLPVIDAFGKLGDASYGIYIYGFPIQQGFMYYFELDTSALILLSVIGSIIFGYVSWHLIEKQALKWKRKPFNRFNRRWLRK